MMKALWQEYAYINHYLTFVLGTTKEATYLPMQLIWLVLLLQTHIFLSQQA